MILAIPLFLTLLVLTIDVANLWLAQIELENGLESAALAAVKEWGVTTTATTETARNAGVTYARLNQVRGLPLVIAPNRTTTASASNPNENLACCAAAGNPPTGNLIFGTITENNPLTFDTSKAPGCGIGTVLFDATGSGTGGLAQDNAWGISFQATPGTPANITIQQIIIDVGANGGGGTFDFSSSGPTISDNLPDPIIPCQPDVAGFTDIQHASIDGDPSQIEFVYDTTTTTPSTLTINFSNDPATSDKGFEPGDHFRFGAKTSGVGPGGGEQDDGDGVGAANVRVTLIFALDGIPQPPVYATFVDTASKQNQCHATCPVHPTGIPDLPCPATSSANNDGQSYVLTRGSGKNDFGVRAQAMVPVNSLSRKIFGACLGPLYVSAKVTARYNCSLNRAWLVEVEKFTCSVP
jgi:hypothetical protein